MKLLQDAMFIIAITTVTTLFIAGILCLGFLLGSAFIMPLKYLYQMVVLGQLGLYYSILFGIFYVVGISLTIMTILAKKINTD